MVSAFAHIHAVGAAIDWFIAKGDIDTVRTGMLRSILHLHKT